MTNLLDKIESLVEGNDQAAPVVPAATEAPAESAMADGASLAAEVKTDAAPLVATIKADAVRLFDHASVDLAEELPSLVAKLGVNTSDSQNVGHAILVTVVQLLAQYGPAEIRTVLTAL